MNISTEKLQKLNAIINSYKKKTYLSTLLAERPPIAVIVVLEHAWGLATPCVPIRHIIDK